MVFLFGITTVRTLADYGIKKESTIYAVLRLRSSFMRCVSPLPYEGMILPEMQSSKIGHRIHREGVGLKEDALTYIPSPARCATLRSWVPNEGSTTTTSTPTITETTSTVVTNRSPTNMNNNSSDASAPVSSPVLTRQMSSSQHDDWFTIDAVYPSVSTIEKPARYWQITIRGAPDTPYEGGIFLLWLSYPVVYLFDSSLHSLVFSCVPDNQNRINIHLCHLVLIL
jgi:hypothetical protein